MKICDLAVGEAYAWAQDGWSFGRGDVRRVVLRDAAPAGKRGKALVVGSSGTEEYVDRRHLRTAWAEWEVRLETRKAERSNLERRAHELRTRIKRAGLTLNRHKVTISHGAVWLTMSRIEDLIELTASYAASQEHVVPVPSVRDDESRLQQLETWRSYLETIALPGAHVYLSQSAREPVAVTVPDSCARGLLSLFMNRTRSELTLTDLLPLDDACMQSGCS